MVSTIAGVELLLFPPSLEGDVTTALDALKPNLLANAALPSSHFKVLMIDLEESTLLGCDAVGWMTANVTFTSRPIFVMF